MANRFNPNEVKGSRSFQVVFWAVFIGVALALVIANCISPYATSIINGLFSGLTPLIIAVLLAFICYKLVNFIERVLLKKAFVGTKHQNGYKRAISLTIVSILIISFVVMVIYTIVPKVIEVIKELTSEDATYYSDKITTQINDLITSLLGTDVSLDIQGFLNSITSSITQTYNSLSSLLQVSTSVISVLFAIITGIIFAVLMLKDKEKIVGFAKRYAYASFKKERADEICIITGKSKEILFNYFISKFIEFAILFFLSGFLYMVLDLKYAWEFAFIVSLFNFIPYFGVPLALLPVVAITIIFGTVQTAFYVILLTAIIFMLVTGFVTPFITGHKIKISGLLVAVSIILGGAMFGLVGMLFAPPFAALVSVIIKEKVELREKNNLAMQSSNASHSENTITPAPQVIATITTPGNVQMTTAQDANGIFEITSGELKEDRSTPSIVILQKSQENLVKQPIQGGEESRGKSEKMALTLNKKSTAVKKSTTASSSVKVVDNSKKATVPSKAPTKSEGKKPITTSKGKTSLSKTKKD